MSDQEQKVQKAVDDVEFKRFRSIRQSAMYNGVSPTTVAYRVGGRKAKSQSQRKNQRFTNQEEKSIVQWLCDLQRQHISPNYARITEMLQNLAQKKGQMELIDKHFIIRFVKRHTELKSGFSHTMNAKRMSALDVNIVKAFFLEFNRLKTKYNVEIKDIYNMNETGF